MQCVDDFVSDPKQPEVRGRRATVVVQPAAAALEGLGATSRFSAEAVDANGFVLAGQAVVWRSLNPEIATVDAATGSASAVASGQAIIEAKAGEGSGRLLGYALVTVSMPAPAAVSLLDSVTSGTAQQLNAFWGSAPSNVYAVGALGTVLHFDGESWTSVAGDVAAGVSVWGIWGAAPSDVYAVGDVGAVLHFDGQTWAPENSGTAASLRDVWGASPRDVFAVGANGTVQRFDGLRWETMSSGTTQNLRAVWGSSASDVYAVGDGGTVLHYDGRTWQAETAPSAAVLTDIWGVSAEQVVIVGASGTVLRRRGGAWTLEPTGVTEVLNTVWGTSAQNTFAAGEGGTLLHFTGGAWQRVTVPTAAGLRAVFGFSTGEVFLGGAAGTLLATARATGPALAFTRVPAGSVVAGDSFEVEVRVIDGTGATVTMAQDTIVVALAGGPAGALLEGTTSVVASSGIAAFGLRLTSAGTSYVLSATATGHAAARSPSFGVGPTAAAGLRFRVQPAATPKGTPIRPAPQVEVVDSFGNVKTFPPTDVTLFLRGPVPNAIVEGATAQRTILGVATYDSVLVKTASNADTLVATSPGLALATSEPFQVLGPGTPGSVTIVPEAVTVDQGDTVRLNVEVRDGDGVLLPGVSASLGSSNGDVVTFLITNDTGTSRTAPIALGTGQTVMTATVADIVGRAVVTVKATAPIAISNWSAGFAGNRTLYGVWGSGGNWAAVGENGTFAYGFGTFPPDVFGVSTETLRAVFSLDGANFYAVSDGGALVRVDATTRGFQEVARQPGVTFRGLWAAGPDTLVLIGDLGGRCFNLECLYRYDGRSILSFANNGFPDFDLANAVWGTSRTTLFTAREAGRALLGSVERTCTAEDLLGVWGTSRTDVFLVGRAGTILHWDGNNCVLMQSPLTVDLYAVSGFGPNDVYAVGAGGTILHYDGGAWTLLPSVTTATLRAVAAYSQQETVYAGGNIIPEFRRVVAVGDGGVFVMGAK